MPQVVKEVRQAERERRERGQPRRGCGADHVGADQYHGERQVESAEVAQQVLVERPVHRHPAGPEAGKVLVEAHRRDQRPEPDRDLDQAEEEEQYSADCPLHAHGTRRRPGT